MKASIIITCYNRQKLIGRAIRSALSQNFPQSEYEVIVVDDGSADHSREIIDDFGEAVVKIYHDNNKGLPAARNSGIRKALGRYVMHLDSDDYIHRDTLYILEMHLSHNPTWGAVSCDYILVDEHENHIARGDGWETPIACGILFRRDNLISIGLYDEEMRLWEDRELRMRYLAKYKIGHVYLPLYRYTDHARSMTKKEEDVRKYNQILEKKRKSRNDNKDS